MTSRNTSAKHTSPSSAKASNGSARAVFETLREATSHPRSIKNLENVWAALEHMRSAGSREFSYKNVAKAIEGLAAAGGERPSPAYSSIRNDEKGIFKPLIDAYATEFGAPRVRADPDDDLLRGIDDRHTRARLSAVFAENRALRSNINNLKRLLKQTEIGSVGDEDSGAPLGHARLLVASPSRDFEPREVEAVRHFIDNLEELDMELTEAGAIRVRSDTGGSWEYIGPAFGSALRKIVASDDS